MLFLMSKLFLMSDCPALFTKNSMLMYRSPSSHGGSLLICRGMDGFRLNKICKNKSGFGSAKGEGAAWGHPEPPEPPRWLGPITREGFVLLHHPGGGAAGEIETMGMGPHTREKPE